MDSATRRIPDAVWEQHKLTILQLIDSNTKAQVVRLLQEDHGLVITLSQLEAKLKAWNHRQNLTRDEWLVVLDELDRVPASSRSSRVSISRRPVSQGRIERARRHCKSGGSRSNNRLSRVRPIDLSQVHIDVLQEDGQWHLHTDFRGYNGPQDTESAVAARSVTPLAQGEHNSPPSERERQAGTQDDILAVSHESEAFASFDAVLNQDLNHLDSSDGNPEPASNDIFHMDADSIQEIGCLANRVPDLLQPMEGFRDDLDHGWSRVSLPTADFQPHAEAITTETEALQGGQVLSPTTIGMLTSALRSPSDVLRGHELPPCWPRGSMWLDGLPFSRFERALKAAGIDLAGTWLIMPRTDRLRLAQQNSLQVFVNGLPKQKQNPVDSSYLSDHSQVYRRILISMKNIVPAPSNQGQFCEHGSHIQEDAAFCTNFNRTLIGSMVNGCAGLQGIPVEHVLKHLMHYRHTSSHLLQFLRHSKSHVARALAENLFRAAIEARNETALRAVLEVRSIDVNNLLCIIDEHKFTPIGRAAYLGSLDLVRLLRQKGARPAGPLPSGVRDPFIDMLKGLRHLIDDDGDDASLTASPLETLNIAREFLDAGCKVTCETLRELWVTFHTDARASAFWTQTRDDLWKARTNLTNLVANEAIQQSHSGVVDSYLDIIANDLDDSQAAAAISDILRICSQDASCHCLIRASAKIDWAAVVAARFGKRQLLQQLLPHANRLHRVLSAAIRYDSTDMIEAVLALGPDLVAPAHNIVEDEFGDNYHRIYSSTRDRDGYITSFSEAVLAGNDDLIRLIDAHGYFDMLEDGRRLRPALTAAAETNDLELTHDLLDPCHHPQPQDLAPALYYALKNENEEIVGLLLDAGVCYVRCSRPADLRPLCTYWSNGQIQRARPIINALYGANSTFDLFRPEILAGPETSLLTITIRKGSISTLSDILDAFPQLMITGDELVGALKRCDSTVLDFLVKSGRCHRAALTQCLIYAADIGNEQLMWAMVDKGASLADDRLLCTVAKNRPLILSTVLERVARTKQFVNPGSCQDALISIIKQGQEALEQIDTLLRSGVVDLWNLGHGMRRYDAISPFGSAIKECVRSHGGNTKVVKLFLDAGGNPDSIVKTKGAFLGNQTALILAIETRSLDTVKLLLQYGANINKSASLGVHQTPLQKACEVGSLEIVKYLLKEGADPNGKPASCRGRTALQLAAINGNCNIAAELLDHGADLFQPPIKAGGRWPLEGAAENGRIEMIEYLWKVSMAIRGLGFDDTICKYAMKYAEEGAHLACRDFIKKLMENGPPNLEDESTESLYNVL